MDTKIDSLHLKLIITLISTKLIICWLAQWLINLVK